MSFDKENNKNAHYYFQRGMEKFTKWDFKGAIEDFNQSISLDTLMLITTEEKQKGP
jgi:hypothetical protein